MPPEAIRDDESAALRAVAAKTSVTEGEATVQEHSPTVHNA